MTSDPKEKEYTHTGCQFSRQLPQEYITAGDITARHSQFFIVATKVACAYVDDA